MLERVLTIEDHPLFAEALRLAVCHAFPEASVVNADTIEEAHEAISDNAPIDLLILDLWLPETHGLLGLLELRQAHPKLPIVVLSAFSERNIVEMSVLCGASGFICKSARKSTLVAGLRAVLQGRLVMPANDDVFEFDLAEGGDAALQVRLLTHQQLRVLLLLCRGMLNKQIAFELGIGETTVKAHVSGILRKLGVNSRTQAVAEVSKLDFEARLRNMILPKPA